MEVMQVMLLSRMRAVFIFKINIISNSHIKLTYAESYYSETVHFYK